jgi:DNA-binding GntR family transcriptional regulator
MAMSPSQALGPTETERVRDALKADILAGRLPAGTTLRQGDLAKRLKTSRTPVREAVAGLASEFLVNVSPRRGARVAHLSIRDYLEVNQLRWILEGFAARVAAERVTEPEIARAERALAELVAGDPTDVSGLAGADQLVHGLIARHCNNRWMRRYIEQLNGMMAVARMGDLERRRDEMVASLTSIVDSLRSRDADAAERLMEDHIKSFSGQLPLLLQRRG